MQKQYECTTCGKTGDLDMFGECRTCQDARDKAFNEYMDEVYKYVSDQNITRNTKYRYWWSNGPWDSNQKLQHPPPEILKDSRPALGRKQLSAEMGRARQLNNANFWRGEIYLARTGEKLKYPIEDIDMVLNPI